MNLRLNSNTPRTRVEQMHQIASLHITFDCDAAFDAPVGTPVKLDSASKVVVATKADKPIGIVHIPKNTDHIGKPCVGVLTEFKAELVAVAQAAVNAGQPVAIHSVSAGALRVAVAASGEYAIGVALSSAAAGADIQVGILSTSHKV
jgi:hypothetical protein